MKQNIAVSVLI